MMRIRLDESVRSPWCRMKRWFGSCGSWYRWSMRSVLNSEAAALDAVDLVALVQQQLGEVGAVLAGDAGEADAGKAGSHTANDFLIFFAVVGKVLGCKGSGADNTHRTKKDIKHLWYFVELSLAEKTSHRENSRIMGNGDIPGTQVGAVLEHGRKLVNLKRPFALANPFLQIEYLPLAGKAENGSNGDSERKKEDCRDQRQDDIENSLQHSSYIRWSRFFPVSM
jgi:hypothetical protein